MKARQPKFMPVDPQMFLLRASRLGMHGWSKAIRREPCSYCLRKGLSMGRDHIKPRSQGGPDCWENRTVACTKCDSKKGSQSLLRFLHGHPLKDQSRNRKAHRKIVMPDVQRSQGDGNHERTNCGVPRLQQAADDSTSPKLQSLLQSNSPKPEGLRGDSVDHRGGQTESGVHESRHHQAAEGRGVTIALSIVQLITAVVFGWFIAWLLAEWELIG